MKTYSTLAINNVNELLYGVAPHPVATRQGLLIGGGLVYPELNFTLPAMLITEETFPKVREHYKQIISETTQRAAELETPGLVIEFETLPDMTRKPDWAIDLVKILLEGIDHAHAQWGLRSVLRMTPNDNREMVRPPLMRQGEHWASMQEVFNRSAELGAELLSIESVGGKEVHDEALISTDLPQVLFSLCIMGVRDMRFLWTELVRIAERHGVLAAGDTACGFGNTAMVMADRGMIPKVFAAVDRAITAVRSLVAYECGAVGPGKDCGYENPILKAITGRPMAMEGKSAACAHLSCMGNLAMATCDLWSNESVQNLKLLSAMAPVVSVEQLIYDCRLLNRASRDTRGHSLTLRDWLVESDASLDPQAYILTPENCLRLARVIVQSEDHYQAGKNVAREAIAILREGMLAGQVNIPPRERPYLDRMQEQLDGLPDSQTEFVEIMMKEVDTTKFVASEYDLA